MIPGVDNDNGEYSVILSSADIYNIYSIYIISTYPPARADDPIELALFEDPSVKITQ